MLKSASAIAALGSKDPRDEHVRRIMRYCADLCDGVRTLGSAGNRAAVGLINRSVVEQFITLRWITLSIENANEHRASTEAALIRVTKANLERGLLRIFDRETGSIATDEVLSSDRFKKVPKPRPVSSKAEAAGVGDLYDLLYRFMSLDTHGHANDEPDLTEESVIGQLHVTGALSKVIGHSAVYWLRAREIAKIENVRALLLGKDDEITL